MTAAADRLVTNAEIHTLSDPETVFEAMAIRDGEIVRLGDSSELEFLNGVETDVIDCDGRVVLPGFIDAHTHMEQLGQHLVHADLSAATSADECLELLAAEGDRTASAVAADADSDAAPADERSDDWIIGFGYDESTWTDRGHRLTRVDLDAVSETRPVAALRVDLHTVSLNSVALERLADEMPDSDIVYEDGDPVGIAVEDAAEVVRREVAADREQMRDLLTAAAEYAVARGVTGVHDKVRSDTSPRVYRELAAAGELPIRVRIDYWSDYLEALSKVGLVTNAGNDRVQTGAIKSFSDGSIGSRTAKLREPYTDADVDDESETEDEPTSGQWVVDPAELTSIVERADDARFQLSVHAIGDEAIEETLSALEETADPADSRHRIEHAELATDDQLERMADAGIVASMQPNFHRWADEGGLYDQRLGRERRERSNPLGRVLEVGAPLAFGSDGMPLGPLLGVHHAVNAPSEDQRLSVTEALRAYTRGAAYAGFDEDRLGTLAVGKRADFVVLEASPWDQPERIGEIDVALTAVDGEVVFERE
ncbi:amidohydrolase [Natronolimnobius baerhuensis]|uniref:Amidohydrolase n=1 Tax=Natronolimnobius baerhuensis TaxID=253108 RepID=A0A202E6Z1_9EURY|nr:amidohydrolase [Natronolimnobius baerhuensis]OVE84032.1 amidohydrolase [Natronolimnobius baerhuensis]